MRWRELLHLNETQPLPDDFFERPRHVHFLGIGGIGMSALAFLLQHRGHQISGSDENDGVMPQKLREAGLEVFIGHDAANLGEAEAVFYSSAIPADNAEFAAARQKALPQWHRSQLLAHFVNTAKTSIAVSGTHGKSTTSAMIAHILTETGHNPTAILGAVYPPFNSNFRVGNPDLIVVEADESDGSFTLLKPTVAVVLNVEPEHLENYDESEDELWRAFEMFTKANEVVLNGDEQERGSRLDDGEWSFFYGLQNGHLTADIKGHGQGRTLFTLKYNGKDIHGEFSLPVPGIHNVSNSLAALGASGLALTKTNASFIAQAASHLSTFAGTLRRFERKGEAGGVLVFDDYGHHPTEVKVTLEAAKEFFARPLCVVFQPHRYSRTQALWREFGAAFGAADTVIITQLYSAHEEPIPGVSGELVYNAVKTNTPEKTVFYATNLDEAQKLALENLRSGDALLTMGAGDITKLGPRILQELATR